MDVASARIGVVGAGSWGTALASLLGMKGYRVALWAYETEVRDSIADFHENKVFMPGIPLSENITPSNNIKEVVSDKDLVVVVVPSHVLRETAAKFGPSLSAGTILVSASKGIENKTHLTMTGVLEDVLPESFKNRLAVLSGPSFGREVAQKVPTVVTAASADPLVALYVQNVFSTPFFRVYTHHDTMGVELGGAVKNVIAIASGIIDGMNLGLNTRAALITRGLAEMRRLGVRLGANPLTFSGLAGMGDLILTCTGTLSRNYTVGKLIGEGKKLDEILADMKMVAEGVKTAKSVRNLSRRVGVEMPISEAVYDVLYEGLSPKEAVYRLMTRDLKDEMEDI
ncbi:MAG: glycerol-3-phosphate dehydrogenase [Desulfobacterales bacterium CG23_combo_of_CG06-09_8_20_14_all_51_8]|nr:MAG: glycerol-3-phosphate dehydrogenase [Desulfobacterales bacterium CG23_combo_of_CG06-09_8_20_14_all_51_8]